MAFHRKLLSACSIAVMLASTQAALAMSDLLADYGTAQANGPMLVAAKSEPDKYYQTGKASWYQMGHTTASGAPFNPDALTAAHKTLPHGTRVRVENFDTGCKVDVVINDRGPFNSRIIDVSRGAARQLCMYDAGVARVGIIILSGPKVGDVGSQR